MDRYLRCLFSSVRRIKGYNAKYRLPNVIPSYRYLSTSDFENRNQSRNANDSNHTSQQMDPSTNDEMISYLSDSNFKERILELSLAYVPKYGWSPEAIEACCLAESFRPGLHSFVAPRGGIDLVLHFYKSRNDQLTEAMQQWRTNDELFKSSTTSSSSANVDEFLYRSLEYRLRELIPVLNVWPQAMGLLALPPNIPSSVGMLGQLVDEIWAQAGDRSTDMSWYAKRLGLAYVYNLSEVYMLQDKSADFENTWKFVRHRIADLRSLKNMDLKAVGSLLRDGVYAFGNVTCNMIGWNRRA